MFTKTVITTIGKTQKEFIDVEAHYLKLVKTKISLSIHPTLSYLSESEQIKKESELLMKDVDDKSFAICLDPLGKHLSTEEFSDMMQKWSAHESTNHKSINFIIGGSYGLSPEIKNKTHYVMSLSNLTMPHQLARIILLEQIYRAETIFSGKKYHK